MYGTGTGMVPYRTGSGTVYGNGKDYSYRTVKYGTVPYGTVRYGEMGKVTFAGMK